MPTLGAMLVASVVGWLVDDLVGSYLNLPLRVLLNLVLSICVFYFARGVLLDLRGR